MSNDVSKSLLQQHLGNPSQYHQTQSSNVIRWAGPQMSNSSLHEQKQHGMHMPVANMPPHGRPTLVNGSIMQSMTTHQPNPEAHPSHGHNYHAHRTSDPQLMMSTASATQMQHQTAQLQHSAGDSMPGLTVMHQEHRYPVVNKLAPYAAQYQPAGHLQSASGLHQMSDASMAHMQYGYQSNGSTHLHSHRMGTSDAHQNHHHLPRSHSWAQPGLGMGTTMSSQGMNLGHTVGMTMVISNTGVSYQPSSSAYGSVSHHQQHHQQQQHQHNWAGQTSIDTPGLMSYSSGPLVGAGQGRDAPAAWQPSCNSTHNGADLAGHGSSGGAGMNMRMQAQTAGQGGGPDVQPYPSPATQQAKDVKNSSSPDQQDPPNVHTMLEQLHKLAKHRPDLLLSVVDNLMNTRAAKAHQQLTAQKAAAAAAANGGQLQSQTSSGQPVTFAQKDQQHQSKHLHPKQQQPGNGLQQTQLQAGQAAVAADQKMLLPADAMNIHDQAATSVQSPAADAGVAHAAHLGKLLPTMPALNQSTATRLADQNPGLHPSVMQILNPNPATQLPSACAGDLPCLARQVAAATQLSNAASGSLSSSPGNSHEADQLN